MVFTSLRSNGFIVNPINSSPCLERLRRTSKGIRPLRDRRPELLYCVAVVLPNGSCTNNLMGSPRTRSRLPKYSEVAMSLIPAGSLTNHGYRESRLAAMLYVATLIRRNKINAKLKELQATTLPGDY